MKSLLHCQRITFFNPFTITLVAKLTFPFFPLLALSSLFLPAPLSFYFYLQDSLSGFLFLVFSITSLIVFFVLIHHPSYHKLATITSEVTHSIPSGILFPCNFWLLSSRFVDSNSNLDWMKPLILDFETFFWKLPDLAFTSMHFSVSLPDSCSLTPCLMLQSLSHQD